MLKSVYLIFNDAAKHSARFEHLHAYYEFSKKGTNRKKGDFQTAFLSVQTSEQ